MLLGTGTGAPLVSRGNKAQPGARITSVGPSARQTGHVLQKSIGQVGSGSTQKRPLSFCSSWQDVSFTSSKSAGSGCRSEVSTAT